MEKFVLGLASGLAGGAAIGYYWINPELENQNEKIENLAKKLKNLNETVQENDMIG